MLREVSITEPEYPASDEPWDITIPHATLSLLEQETKYIVSISNKDDS
jgi:hypothetical protein